MDSGFTTKEILIQLTHTIEQRFNNLEARIDDSFRDQEFRIRKLEKFAWSRPASLITAMVSAAAAIGLAIFH